MQNASRVLAFFLPSQGAKTHAPRIRLRPSSLKKKEAVQITTSQFAERTWGRISPATEEVVERPIRGKQAFAWQPFAAPLHGGYSKRFASSWIIFFHAFNQILGISAAQKTNRLTDIYVRQ
ncbi:MAG: hypothetical protein N2441_08760 [Rhodocyclaceae bacterium]|nr:hypothetical protein [Rhodocyclaceae bacterium]